MDKPHFQSLPFALLFATFVFSISAEAQTENKIADKDTGFVPACKLAYALPLSTQGRVKFSRKKDTRSVVTSDGHLLRGSGVIIFKWGRESKNDRHLYQNEYWKNLKKHGFNAIRVCFFDPWQRSHGKTGDKTPYPYADLNNQKDVEDTLRQLDHIVLMAARHDMYVLINYHDTGDYRDPIHQNSADKNGRFAYAGSMNYINRFWHLVAPRYANQTHVLYELMNEPAAWFPENYTDQVLADIKRLTDQVRKDAPDTHLVLLTFANHLSWKPEQHSVFKVAKRLRNLGVDFKNASVGVHPYNGRHPKPNDKGPLLHLMKEFAVINTEANIPKALNESPNDPDGSGFDGDEFSVQSMERMGISWFHWKIGDPQGFEKYFVGMTLIDAKRKGYYWMNERGQPKPAKTK